MSTIDDEAGATAARLSCFKAYDVRGRVPDDLDAALVRRAGNALAAFLEPRHVAVGHDIRLSSPELAAALTTGLTEAGVDVVDIGRCGTEEVYFAVIERGLDGGVMVTASHNPAAYNGLKLVRAEGRPISADTGLFTLERMVREGGYAGSSRRGYVEHVDLRPRYVEHLLSYVDVTALKPLHVVVNAGNGGAGAVVDQLEQRLPLRFAKLHHEPDGRFPNGVPNPILPENRRATAEAVVQAGADLGVAWDGDFDRCFLFDEHGTFVEGCYLVPLLAEAALAKHPGASIVHDPRVVWNTIERVTAAGGRPVQSKGGHAFMKETMRRVDAAYGGENPGHHFYREFRYCDSGMIPWLQIVELVCRSGRSLGELVGDMRRRYPTSGELNFTVSDPARVLARIRSRYEDAASSIETLDGLTMTFDAWRFNVRSSNTEPLLRLNIETRADDALLAEKTRELVAMIE